VPLQQIRARKSFSADLTLIWLLLRVHSDMATEMIETSIAFRALPAAIQSLTTRSLGFDAGGRVVVWSRTVVRRRP